MLTPISTKIEEFNKQYLVDEMTTLGYRNPENIRDFLRTALEQRDNEWRELVEGEKEMYRSCITNVAPEIKDRKERKLYTWSMEDHIKALDDIITKSKEI